MKPIKELGAAFWLIFRIKEAIHKATNYDFELQFSVASLDKIVLKAPRGFSMNEVGNNAPVSFQGTGVVEVAEKMRRFFQDGRSLRVAIDENDFQFRAVISCHENTFKVADACVGHYSYHDSLDD
ncbi:MAG: hypothetical protein HYU81_00585 [Candidatus Brennerbacteria bacterium]|nr:hypothetical protein [Candidatus Brennerbacteria bacterium]